jgi:hypothetical protein
MKIFPLTIYVLLKPFIQILPSDSKKSLWDSRTTATLKKTLSSENLLNMAFLRCLLVINVNEQAWRPAWETGVFQCDQFSSFECHTRRQIKGVKVCSHENNWATKFSILLFKKYLIIFLICEQFKIIINISRHGTRWNNGFLVLWLRVFSRI